MLDPVSKAKPANLARDYGDMCLAADGFAQVRCQNMGHTYYSEIVKRREVWEGRKKERVSV